jgi:ribosomal protein S18 acetylase RimI-like enzyme
MDTSILLRDFKSNDYESIQDLWVRLGLGTPQRGDTLKVIENTLLHQGRLLVLTEGTDKRIIGTCWLTCDGRRMYLHHMAVHPDFQNRGLGRRLLTESIRIATAMNLQLKLEVSETNEAAQRLYLNYGFHPLAGHQILIRRK